MRWIASTAWLGSLDLGVLRRLPALVWHQRQYSLVARFVQFLRFWTATRKCNGKNRRSSLRLKTVASSNRPLMLLVALQVRASLLCCPGLCSLTRGPRFALNPSAGLSYTNKISYTPALQNNTLTFPLFCAVAPLCERPLTIQRQQCD